MTDTVETAAETLPSGFGCVEEPVLYLTGSGELLDWNPAFAELIGGVDTDSTTATADVLDSEDRRRLQNGVTNALETGRETLTVSIQSKTGAETGLELSLVSVSDEWTTASRVVGIGRVIETPETPGSERLETDGLSDDRRRQERERYETLINQSTDGVMVVRDGRYDFVNERFAELSGYDTEELLGMSFKKVVAPEYHDLVQERYEKRLAGESPPDTYEIEIVRADGQRRTLELSSSPLRESGETTILANVRDITHRKRREQAISTLQDATAQIQTADSPQQIADIAVDAATDILETERAICWLYDAESDTLEPTAVTDPVETQA
ncbi:MAG: PAS domain S-box protein, partial [Natronomonas sp.]